MLKDDSDIVAPEAEEHVRDMKGVCLVYNMMLSCFNHT